MKLRSSPKKLRGHILLVLLAIIAIAAILYLGWKIIQKLRDAPFGNPDRYTNIVDEAWSERMPALRAMFSNDTITVTLPQLDDFTLTLPVEALASQWYVGVQSSTNLRDWTWETLDWTEALAAVRTNQHLPAKFYRRILLW